MIIVYCEKCGRRVTDNDMADGRAVQSGENVWFCAACAPAPAASQSSTQPMKALSPSQSTARLAPSQTTTRMRAPGSASKRNAPATQGDIDPERKGPNWIVLGMAAGAVMLGAGLILLILNRGKPASEKTPISAGDSAANKAPQPAPTVAKFPAAPANAPAAAGTASQAAGMASPTATVPDGATEPEGPELSMEERRRRADKEMEDIKNKRDEVRLKHAGTLLEEVRAWSKQNPQDPWTYRDKLREIVSSYGASAAAVEARKLLEGMKDLPPPPDRLDTVPEAKEYQLVLDLDISKTGGDIRYDADHREKIKSAFDRIAYFMELQPPNGETQYVFVSMDAFTADVNKIGVPTVASGARFQQKVASLNVYSNVKGIVTGTGLSGGNIEFWPSNYGQGNKANVPNADSHKYDFGDDPQQGGGHGSMQVHNHEAKQTLFALNRWGHGSAELGIGNNPDPGGNPDWTFAKTAGSYRAKRLRVLVRSK